MKTIANDIKIVKLDLNINKLFENKYSMTLATDKIYVQLYIIKR